MAVFVSNIEMFEEHLAGGSKATLILGGDLVYITNEKSSINRLQQEAGDRYILQPPRVASKGSFLDSKKEYLFIAVSKTAAEYAQSYRGNVLLAADHYVAYGLSQRKDCIIIGGGVTSDSGGDVLNLEIFVFSNGRLISTMERNTSSSSFMLELTLRDVVSKYPDYHIFWCDPLGVPPFFEMTTPDLFDVVGDAPIKHLIKRKLVTRSHDVEEGWGLLPAAAVGLLGVLIFLIGVGYQWYGLESERSVFKDEVSGYEVAYSNSTQSLDLLRHRSFLLESQPEALARVDMLQNLLSKTAQIDNVLIHSIKVFAPDDIEAISSMQTQQGSMLEMPNDEFRVEFSVPKSENLGARDQAEPIVAMLNKKIGMTVRVIDHRSENIVKGDSKIEYWRYQIGGAKNVI